MSGRVHACSSIERIPLTAGWEVGAAGPGAAGPGAAGPAGAATIWSPAPVPGTVASALRDSGQWSLDAAARDFDADTWWYRTRFSAPAAVAGERVMLAFEGLATLADVWLNGSLILHSTNMFLAHRCDVGATLAADNELLIRFESIGTSLRARRPRARWRTPMVAHQQLRWVRTSLLGRTPGWSPPAAPVGPWRPVWLERHRLVDVGDHRLRATVVDATGRLHVSCAVTPLGGVVVTSARLIAERGGRLIETELSVQTAAGGVVAGHLDVPNVDLWWPHTHGVPALYRASMVLTVSHPELGETSIDVDFGHVGFRHVELERAAGRFAVRVNGKEIFCRGATWTPLDCVSLQADDADYGAAIERVRGAGMNMLRVAGPMVYETDGFLDLCDAAGILLWQDFMFANMDYPADDAVFAGSVRAEVEQQLSRLQARPSLALLCGNSEGAQQAAMSGASREAWAPRLFETELAALSQVACPDVPYCPSSTHGGAFPFQASVGVTSYYGVGAYLKPLHDARRADVRFASECLAFANVPEGETLAALAQDGMLRCHHPHWKERVPRDLGAGWDFDDVRDHYLSVVFRVDPLALRYNDYARYLQLSRAVSGEVMAATLADWRRSSSNCRGALIWFLCDLWPGAGWGVIDSTGLPKAPYYYLRRVLQPLAVFATDEGTNGVMIHLVNDAPVPIRALLELRQFRLSNAVGRPVGKTLCLGAASAVELAAVDLYEGFSDLSHAYRFGPIAYDLLHVRLLREEGEALLAETFHFPGGIPNDVSADVGLSADVARIDDATFEVVIRCREFAQSVHLDIPGFLVDDQYFHMAPNSARTLAVRRRRAGSEPLEGAIYALNALAHCRIAHAP